MAESAARKWAPRQRPSLSTQCFAFLLISTGALLRLLHLLTQLTWLEVEAAGRNLLSMWQHFDHFNEKKTPTPWRWETERRIIIGPLSFCDSKKNNNNNKSSAYCPRPLCFTPKDIRLLRGAEWKVAYWKSLCTTMQLWKTSQWIRKQLKKYVKKKKIWAT